MLSFLFYPPTELVQCSHETNEKQPGDKRQKIAMLLSTSHLYGIGMVMYRPTNKINLRLNAESIKS